MCDHILKGKIGLFCGKEIVQSSEIFLEGLFQNRFIGSIFAYRLRFCLFKVEVIRIIDIHCITFTVVKSRVRLFPE